jgi:hypothetical protein
MNFSIKTAVIIVLTSLMYTSCRKEEQPVTTAQTGTVNLEFFNVAGGSNLQLNSKWYINEHGDSFTVSRFNYYISNIVLNGSSGTGNYTEHESYHLVEHSSNSSDMAFKLSAVPAGKYSSIKVTIGVDSLRNVSGAQTGALDPALGNFWSWNSGYIMLKLEGTSPKSTAVDGKVLFHCGGFSGANNVLKTITLNFPNEVEVTTTSNPHIHVQADMLTLFKGPNVIDFAVTNTIHMPGASARHIADNYAGMFTITYAGL